MIRSLFSYFFLGVSVSLCWVFVFGLLQEELTFADDVCRPLQEDRTIPAHELGAAGRVNLKRRFRPARKNRGYR